MVSIHAPARGATPHQRFHPVKPLCFNPRARAGRDQDEQLYNSTGLQFQSTRPRGARPGRVFAEPGGRWFQSTRPRGARRPVGDGALVDAGFQSTRPRGARHRHGEERLILRGFQSTRPRGARRRPPVQRQRFPRVSIHAPARGATSFAADMLGAAMEVSIHAPARGATLFPGLAQNGVEVSIHAPARGATTTAGTISLYIEGFNPRARAGRDPPRSHQRPAWCGFNPRARAGRDPGAIAASTAAHKFQSTRPRGARQEHIRQATVLLLFQSTRPRGARPGVVQVMMSTCEVSIHAPARGATKGCADRRPATARFNPRARAGRDFGESPVITAAWLFQSTRPRGARPESSSVQEIAVMFQSTRPRGARLNMGPLTTMGSRVSIHAPARGATGRCSPV